MKKILLFLILALVFQSVNCFGAPIVNYDKIDCSDIMFQAGSFSGPYLKNTADDGIATLSSLYDSKALYDAILAGLQARSSTIYVYTLNLVYEPTDARDTYSRIINEHPELCYVSPSVSMGHMVSNGTKYLYSIVPEYLSEIGEEQIKIFNDKVDYIISRYTTDAMTDREKALAIHDYIVSHCEYGQVDNPDDPDYFDLMSFSPYGTLIRGKSVCQGYALSYELILRKLGIECIFVSSDTMYHAWNMLKIDGKWYHTDVTWDDPTNYEMTSHLFFLKSDTAFSTPDSFGDRHYGWAEYNPKCTDTSYDNVSYPYANQILPFTYIDGYFWYGGVDAYGRNIPYAKTDFEGKDRITVSATEFLPKRTNYLAAYAPLSYADGTRVKTTKETLKNSLLMLDNLTDKNEEFYVYTAKYIGNKLTNVSADCIYIPKNSYKAHIITGTASTAEKVKIIVMNEDYENITPKAYQY